MLEDFYFHQVYLQLQALKYNVVLGCHLDSQSHVSTAVSKRSLRRSDAVLSSHHYNKVITINTNGWCIQITITSRKNKTDPDTNSLQSPNISIHSSFFSSLHGELYKALSAIYCKIMSVIPSLDTTQTGSKSGIQALRSLHVAHEKSKNVVSFIWQIAGA
ncbi:uncharacterized protein LOC125476166 [Pyrus x bretschneideri]|uniref:uncharacterized protein LOC125476166 n=1 Tax=Pyrus x bretschneideri TaxID=225117 RepID=UPI00202E4C4D|nr:uncharacterized protein LOC125476166 [Pyrus x bretschneideri]